MPIPLRIFISSPGDVPEERLRAGLIIQKLARDYAPYFAVEPYFWEYEPMLASGHFQDAIEPPSAADIVVLVLWSRLGTPLPERTSVREYKGMDGRVPVTGTEWEFEDALAANLVKGAPDLLVYRRLGDPGASLTNPVLRAEQERQWNALEAFWSQHFENRGVLLAGSAKYTSLEEFDRKLETDLACLIERRVQDQYRAEQDGPAPIWLKGSPFRGLAVYDITDAPVFFGRDGEVRTALTRLQEAAARGTAFLLVLGASGSGKSSLARAGLVAGVAAAKAVPGVGLWRRAVMRPGDAGTDPVLALAHAVLAGDPEQGEGLPELVGPRITATDLAQHLRLSAQEPSLPFRLALYTLAERERGRRALLGHEEARLVLLVDQLEELFTRSDISASDSTLFARLLSGLARSGLIWVIATLRSDLWHRTAEIPDLVALTEAGARLDLLPPDGAALLEMVRQPARAAGLSFDTDPQNGLGLDAVLAQAAAEEPGALPLLSVMLDTLYQRDVLAGESRRLTFPSYRSLGELTGAIAQRAEEILASLEQSDPESAATLSEVLRALVTTRVGNAVTAQPARLEQFIGRPAQVRLVQRFLATDARLLTAEDRGQGAEVRLAHEALIEHWPRANKQITRDRRDLETRSRLETLLRRYETATDRKERQRSLLNGLALEEGIDLARRWHIGPETALGGFVAASARAAKLRTRQVVAAGAALVLLFTGVATFATLQWREADAKSALATRNENLALKEAQNAKMQKLTAEDQRNRALITQSRFLADQANQHFGTGDVGTAMLLALEALPDAQGGLERPYAPEAEAALFNAQLHLRERLLLQGHTGGVRSAVFSPDGRHVLTASPDRTARIWDAQTGRQVAVLEGHTSAVLSAVFSPDGQHTLTASDDGTARIWDAQTGQQVAALQGHTRGVLSAVFSPDGRHVLTASPDWTARIWDAQTGRQVAVLKGHTSEVRSAVFSPNGQRVLTTSYSTVDMNSDKTVRIWEAQTGQQIAILVTNTWPVASATFSPDGQRVVTTPLANTNAHIWDAQTGRQIAVLNGHARLVLSAVFSPDGQHTLTASDDGTARIWDAQTGQQVAALQGHTSGVLSAVFSRDGSRVLTASFDRTARIWDAQTGRQIAVLKGHTSAVLSAMFSPDGQHTLTASDDWTARIWHARATQEAVILQGLPSGRWKAVFSPDGQRLLTIGDDYLNKTARIWDAQTGKQVASLEEHPNGPWAVSPVGQRVVTASPDGTARIWDAQTGKDVAVLEGHASDRWTAVFSPNGQRVLTATPNMRARIWDAETGKQLAVLQGHTSAVLSAVFSPDSQRVLTASPDRTARIWDAETGKQVAVLEGHASDLWMAVFSPNGQRVLTTYQYRRGGPAARLWDAQTGKEIAVLQGVGDLMSKNSAVFSPDGQRVLTSGSYAAQVWDPESGKQIAVLQRGAVDSAVFSPDGQRVFTAFQNTARIWEAQSGKLVADLERPTGWVQSAVFSPDGQRVLAYEDNTARIWDTQTGKQVAVLHHGQRRDGVGVVLSPDGQRVSPDGQRVLTSDGITVRVWRVFLTTQALVDEAKDRVARCLSREQRSSAFLEPEPPVWCIEREKWPYHTQGWKEWLKAKGSEKQ